MSVSGTFTELVDIVTTRSVMIGGKAIPLAILFALLRNIPAIGADAPTVIPPRPSSGIHGA